MLEKFNKELNSIIFEAFDISPKFIDKDFQGSFNNVDLFTSKKFFKGISSDVLINGSFIQRLLDKLNLKRIKKETSLIIYFQNTSFVFTAILSPHLAKRYELILLNSWKSDRIPPIETNRTN